ncbi:MAG: hypothetical protein SFY66_10350 [Oculatellaceae cyanobacterium bins.114]|nr:hypothetical protein [Oculatellaceae cyanobacterium bins.114]
MNSPDQSNPNQTRQVTLLISEEVYQRVAQTASHEQRGVEDVLSSLIVEGLNTHSTVRQMFEWVSKQYCDRLSQANKRNQSSSEILQDLQRLREQVAHELYPE